MEIKNNKIIIGTAQFSNNYGLQNYSNTIKEKFDILNKVIHYKCHGIDTALNYDQSQKNIGNWLSKNSNKIKIYTKIIGKKNIKQMELSFQKCLSELKSENIEGLLFHNQDSIKFKETKLFAEKILNNKKINKIGISIYDSYAIPDNTEINFLQIPGSIFNQKFLKSKKLHKYIDKGGEVHIRSIFIQGLLLTAPHKIPKKLQKLQEPLKKFHMLCNENNFDPITVAAQSIKELIPNFKLVIGIDKPSQFDKVMNKINKKIDQEVIRKAIKIGEKYTDILWDPRNWNSLIK